MTQTTTTTSGNGAGHSAMPSSATKRLEQDDRLHEHHDMETDSRLDGDKSSAQLEREVERERAELSGTLNEIRRSLSPGQIVDQAFDYARHSGGREFAENLGRSVRDNPLPVLLMGAGMAWLMAADRGGHASISARSSGSDMGDRMSGAASSASGMASSARKGAGRVSDTASGLASSASNAASDVASSASHAAERAGTLAHDARDGVYRAGERAAGGWSRMAQEQPLMLGAIGIAIGAAIASALPSTRTEDRLMGETSDAVKDQARQTARHEYEHAKEAASEVSRDISESGGTSRPPLAGRAGKEAASPGKAGAKARTASTRRSGSTVADAPTASAAATPPGSARSEPKGN